MIRLTSGDVTVWEGRLLVVCARCGNRYPAKNAECPKCNGLEDSNDNEK